jgi:hypothetical protein
VSIAIGSYVELTREQNYQNFHAHQTRRWNNREFTYASFGYSGSTTDLQSGNVDAQLVFANNQFVLGLANQLADAGTIIRINTVWLNPTTFRELSSYTQDTFMVTGYESDTTRVAFRLSSPLDAVTADVPRRRLAAQLVGSLPSSGDVQLA